jgi:Subtilase family
MCTDGGLLPRSSGFEGLLGRIHLTEHHTSMPRSRRPAMEPVSAAASPSTGSMPSSAARDPVTAPEPSRSTSRFSTAGSSPITRISTWVGGADCAPGQGFDDRDGHGTFVGGMLGARDNSFGVVGVAPGARLWSIRGANADGYIADSWLICGLDFVAATRSDADPSNDIAVANMSLSGPTRERAGCAGTRDPTHIAVARLSTLGLCPSRPRERCAGHRARGARLVGRGPDGDRDG